MIRVALRYRRRDVSRTPLHDWIEVRRPPLCPELSLWLAAMGSTSGGRRTSWSRTSTRRRCGRSAGPAGRRSRGTSSTRRTTCAIAWWSTSAPAQAWPRSPPRAPAPVAIAVDTIRARAAAERNAALNGVTVETSDAPPPEFDVLLAADVLYEEENVALLRALLATAGRVLLLAEPVRRWTRRPAVPAIARYEARAFPDLDPPTSEVSLYRIAAPDEL